MMESFLIVLNPGMPNMEQAGFRSGQGCLFQIYVLFLLIDYAKQHERNLMIGFMDYEKAFDYANRASIISELMANGCGKRFTCAIAKMWNSSTYIPVVDQNKLGEAWPTITIRPDFLPLVFSF